LGALHAFPTRRSSDLFWKRGRSLLELREQVIAEGQAGSEAGGRRKKMAAIEQTAPPDGRKAPCYDCGGKLARPVMSATNWGTRLRRRISFSERLEPQCFSHQNFRRRHA